MTELLRFGRAALRRWWKYRKNSCWRIKDSSFRLRSLIRRICRFIIRVWRCSQNPNKETSIKSPDPISGSAEGLLLITEIWVWLRIRHNQWNPLKSSPRLIQATCSWKCRAHNSRNLMMIGMLIIHNSKKTKRSHWSAAVAVSKTSKSFKSPKSKASPWIN